MSNSTLRPRLHFTPPQNWMNDPNGLVYHQGEYHLFYQYNPYDTAWGHMTWGHTVSSDLLHWEHLPPAIHENAEAGYTIFSGSAVIDADNTAGFGAHAMVAVFTADYREGGADGQGLQDVHIAYSLDRGRTFTEFAGNPVIHVGEAKFGDPKVFWHEASGQWIMVNIQGLPQGHVAIYRSSNLREWTHASDFVDDAGAPGIWECPDLFALDCEGETRWVLKTNNVYGPEDVREHATRYWVGDFDGETFTAETDAQTYRPEDDPFYAEVTYNDVPGDGSSPGERVMLGWLRQNAADHRPWTGAQSLPRALRLAKVGEAYALCHAPIAALDALRTPRPLALWRNGIDAESPLVLAENLARAETGLDIEIETPWLPYAMLLTTAQGRTLELMLDPPRGGLMILGEVEGARGLIAHDDWVEPDVEQSHFGPVPYGERIALRVIIDGAFIEVFAGPPEARGVAMLTAIVSPDNDPIDHVALSVGDVDVLHVYDLAL